MSRVPRWEWAVDPGAVAGRRTDYMLATRVGDSFIDPPSQWPRPSRQGDLLRRITSRRGTRDKVTAAGGSWSRLAPAPPVPAPGHPVGAPHRHPLRIPESRCRTDLMATAQQPHRQKLLACARRSSGHEPENERPPTARTALPHSPLNTNLGLCGEGWLFPAASLGVAVR